MDYRWQNCSHLLGFSVTLQDINVGINILHLEPVIQGQRGIRTNPVQHTAQLKKEGNGLETSNITDNGDKSNLENNFVADQGN